MGNDFVTTQNNHDPVAEVVIVILAAWNLRPARRLVNEQEKVAQDCSLLLCLSICGADNSGIRRFLAMDFSVDESCIVKHILQFLW